MKSARPAIKIIVIGAGLAGAATAHELAERGCEVTVLEASAADANTSPSSSLPAALMATHQSTHDIPISQLSRLGLAATTRIAQAHLQEGEDWQRCGVLLRAGRFSTQAQWLGDAAWIKPASLLRFWLAHPRIDLRSGVAVKQLKMLTSRPAEPRQWQALDAQGTLLVEADAVVLANAFEAKAMLRAVSDHRAQQIVLPDLNLQLVVGQVLMGEWNAHWQTAWPQLLPELAAIRGKVEHPHCAVNGNGHFLPALPWQGRKIWLSGSTYEHDAPSPAITPQGLAANLERLQSLIPAAADLLAQQQRLGQLQAWAGSRCTTHDRLPVVGAVNAAKAPGLFICTALGSRGASFAAVCAQHIAAELLGTSDSPLSSALAQAVSMRHIN
jgi:tRNA 5-methylaminomethyl-2-thiouridine biosynthesis bifunctional protein